MLIDFDASVYFFTHFHLSYTSIISEDVKTLEHLLHSCTKSQPSNLIRTPTRKRASPLTDVWLVSKICK